MHDRDQGMFSRARRAYELGRLVVALRAGLVALAMVALLVALGGANAFTFFAGGTFVLATAFCTSYGKAPGRAARVALAGGVAVSLGLLAFRIGTNCTKTFCDEGCSVVCLSGGSTGGALVSGWILMERLEPAAPAAALMFAGLAASLGSAFAGSEICAVSASAAGLGLAAALQPLIGSKTAG